MTLLERMAKAIDGFNTDDKNGRITAVRAALHEMQQPPRHILKHIPHHPDISPDEVWKNVIEEILNER